MRPALHCMTLLGCALSIAVGGGCALLAGRQQTPTALAQPRPLPLELQLVQRGFGKAASYERCKDSACTTLTPKTPTPLRPQPSQPRVVLPVHVPRLPVSAPAEVVAPAPQPAAIARLVLLFDTDRALLTPVHRARLRELLPQLQGAEHLVIAGRTDDQGSQSRNDALALARALAIRDHLLTLMPDLPARIVIDAKGRCCYASPNDANGRSRNRRVELVAIAPIATHGVSP